MEPIEQSSFVKMIENYTFSPIMCKYRHNGCEWCESGTEIKENWWNERELKKKHSENKIDTTNGIASNQGKWCDIMRFDIIITVKWKAKTVTQNRWNTSSA